MRLVCGFWYRSAQCRLRLGFPSAVLWFPEQSFHGMQEILSVFGFMREHIPLDQFRWIAFVQFQYGNIAELP